MVASLFHPLNIFILGLGGGFLIPLLSRLGKAWVSAAFLFALIGMTLISGVALFGFMTGGFPIGLISRRVRRLRSIERSRGSGTADIG